MLLLGLCCLCAALAGGYVLCNAFVRAVLRTLFWLAKDAVFGRSNARDFPSCHSEVTNPEWLTGALQVKFPGTVVRSATAREMGGDMGNASEMFRLGVEYKANPHDLPGKMICKLPKPGLMSRIPFTAARMNEMESTFYASGLVDDLLRQGLHFPKGFAGKYDARTGSCYSLMEDVSASGCTFTRETSPVQEMDQAVRIVTTLGKLHGLYFNQPASGEAKLKWIVRQTDPVLCMTGEAFAFGWTKFLARFEGRLPEELAAVGGKELGKVAALLHDYMGCSPQVVVHGDCHLENAYFTAEGELGLYDMQLMRVGKGALDLASFVGGSFAPELLGGGIANADGEDFLLRAYYDAMRRAHGSAEGDGLAYIDEQGRDQEYSFTSLQRDYKLALALVFVWNVAASLAIPFDTSAAHDYDEYAVRLFHSVHRTSAVNYAVWLFGLPHYAKPKFHLRGREPKLDYWLQVPPIQRCILGEGTHLAHDVQLHVARLSPQSPQSVLEALVWKPLKYRFIHSKTKSKQGYHGKKTTSVLHKDLESHHSVSYADGTEMEPYALDSYYLSSFSERHSFALRWCRRSCEEKGEVWLVVRVGGDTLVWDQHPSTLVRCFELDKDTVCVESAKARMELTLVVPMQRWKVSFLGQLRNQATGNLVGVRFELETTSMMPHFAFGTSVDPSLTAKSISNEQLSKQFFAELQATHQEHYEQFCDVVGSLQVTDDDRGEQRVEGRGMRDRAFGCRQWSYMARYVASYLCCDNGMVVSFVFASLPTLTNAKFGMVFGFQGSDEYSAIDAMSGDFAQLAADGTPPKEWELAFRTANGANFKIRCFVDGDSVGLDMGPGEMWVHLRFARFHLTFVSDKDGEVEETWGRGASEFGYRVHGCQPLRPTHGVFDPVFAQNH